ncbi:MAG: dephospho-CoA kinase [Alphaproteobacteria bacterium]|nr:dephospho-CoA kinase [Alphaproteobacteria bacterium]
MIVLGLTGSIGMGKSTAANMLEHLGCAIHDSDKAVHKALLPNGQAFEKVAVTFPDAWDKKKRIIKKKVLADIIFNDAGEKIELEKILHPIVQQSQQDFIQNQIRLDRDIVVLDIPLLFETGAEKRMDYTVCVSAPYHIQRRRVLSRPGMSEDKFHSILETQMPDHEKVQRADFVVKTGMGMAHSYRQLANIVREVR